MNHRKLAILHLEDNRFDVAIIKGMLESENFELDYLDVKHRDDYERALTSRTYDLIFADYTLPMFDGISAMEMAKKECPQTPFIFISGTMGEEIAIKSLTNGATDYILKNSLNRLISSVNRALNEAEESFKRQKAEKALLKSLNEKELLLKEIHHRVKNNLQVISSLVNLQMSNIKDKQMLDILQNTRNRINAMLLIHQNLYNSDNLDKIPFEEYIGNLANYLFSIYDARSKNISLKLSIENIHLSISCGIALGLIINELITNSLKYAFNFQSEGIIDIKLKTLDKEKSQVELIISNNGSPFPKEINFTNSPSLGLKLVKTLVDQLFGDIEIIYEPEIQFIINFNLLKNLEV